MIAQLEAMVRRARLLPVLLPVLIFGGWGLGHLTTRAIELPSNVPVRITDASHTPSRKLDRLDRFTNFLQKDGHETEQYIALYQDHVLPVEKTLRGWGVDRGTARKVAWPLVEYSFDRGLDPATVVAIVLVESDGRPSATSFVGARGLMQVMPAHAGMWQGCGRNLYDIESNICNGTSILRGPAPSFQRRRAPRLAGVQRLRARHQHPQLRNLPAAGPQPQQSDQAQVGVHGWRHSRDDLAGRGALTGRAGTSRSSG